MEPPDPHDAIEGQGVYHELVEMMMLFCMECEREEWIDAKEKGDPWAAPQ
jgi:hypothetical protein